jgi:hypothetical protein
VSQGEFEEIRVGKTVPEPVSGPAERRLHYWISTSSSKVASSETLAMNDSARS